MNNQVASHRPTRKAPPIPPVLQINGLSCEVIDKLFIAADQDGDGKLTGQEAVKFFLKTGLPVSVLSQVWEGATKGVLGGISRASFTIALRLVQCAQAGKELTPQNIQLALQPQTSYPPITFTQQPFPEYNQMINFQDQSNNITDFSFRSDSSDFDDVQAGGKIIQVKIERGRDLVACDGGLSDPFCEVVYGINREFTEVCSRTLDPVWDYHAKFIKIENQSLKITCWDKGLMDPDTFIGTIILNEDQISRGVEGWFALQKIHSGHLYIKVEAASEPGSNRVIVKQQSEIKMQSPRALLESTMLRQSTGLVQLEVRLNPLKPTNCGQLKFLGGFRGCLVAGPSYKGGLLLWSEAETLPSKPFGNVKQAQHEDSDNALAAELSVADFGTVSSIYFDTHGCYMLTGHQNGLMCQWNMRQGVVPSIIKSWQAHRVGAVLSVGVTMWGDVWTGSAWGSLRFWPNALNCQVADLRSKELRKSGNERAHSEVTYIVISKSGQIVWTASPNNVNLWDAYTGLFLGTLNRSGGQDVSEGFINIEYGVDPTSLPTFVLRDTVSDTDAIGVNRGIKDRLTVQSAKAAKLFRKFGAAKMTVDEQTNGLSTNIDVQTKYSISSMCSGLDGTVWVGCLGGQVEQYSALGRCLQKMEMHTAITSLAGVGSRIWIGLADGQVHICNLDGSPLKLIPMHDASVIGLQVVGPIAYTLGARGKIRGWSAWAPSGADQQSQSAWLNASNAVVQNVTVRILCGTWNVNETKPSSESIQKWLSPNKFESADLVVVGLQEVEMGTGSVAAAAAKERVYKQWLEQGNRNAQWWLTEVQNALEMGKQKWVRVGLRQMSGMLIICMIREGLQAHVGDVLTASVACGVAGIGGNKGAVALSFQLYRHRFAFINSHFAAHQKDVDKRNADYATIVKNLKFSNVTEAAKVGEDQEDQLQDMIETGQGMKDADVLVWLGDFNYRINHSRETTENFLRKRDLEGLFKSDQCAIEMEMNKIFHGLREGKVSFMPTYKYDKNTTDPMAYDSGEKRRIPAWTDRIFFRGSRQFSLNPQIGNEDGVFKQQSTQREYPEETIVRALAYDSCPEVPDSDHKPVWAAIWAEVPVVQQDVKRKEVAKILQQNASINFKAARLVCKQQQWQLQQGIASKIEIENTGEGDGVFMFVGLDNSPLPEWLQVQPVQGWIPAAQKTQVSVLAIVSDKEFYLVQDMVKEISLRFQWAEILTVGGKGFGQDTKRSQTIHVTCVKQGGRSL